MASATQLAALKECYEAAKASGHIFPGAAAAEGAVESAWFTSRLFKEDMNVFGTKQHEHPIYGTANLPTKEYLHHTWVVVNAEWVKYPTVADSFQDRMNTLVALSPHYPHYANALKAITPEQFVNEVSITWSTGPARAAQVLSVYHAHLDILRG